MNSEKRQEYAEDLARERYERRKRVWRECEFCGRSTHKDDLVRGLCAECRDEGPMPEGSGE